MTDPQGDCRARLRHLAADILGLPSAAREALSERPYPSRFPGLCVPRSIGDIDRRIGARESAFVERDELAHAIERAEQQRPVPTPLHPAQLANLEKLAAPGSQVVLCGQQPAFLGGPLLDLYKALHTVVLARALSEAWRSPVVPLFWCHSDDHDLAETNHAYLVNQHLDLTRVGLPGFGSGRRSLASLPLDAEHQRLPALRAQLNQLLPATPHRDALLDAFFPVAGETLGDTFVRGWSHLLGSTGLLFLEPRTIRTPLTRALARWVERDLAGGLERGLTRLHPDERPAELGPDRVAWVFRHTDTGRQALRHEAGAFKFDGEAGSRTGGELAAWMLGDPTAWSAGVLLRPLVQDDCLPTAAYVGGWGEFAYHLPLLGLREEAGRPAPAFVPRLSATLSSPALRAALERLDTDVEQALRTRAGTGAAPSAPRPGDQEEEVRVARRIRQEAANWADRMRSLQPELSELDRGLALQLKRASRDAQQLFDRLARKAERVDANRRGKSRRHWRRVENTLWSNGAPQERVLTALQYAVVFGTDWIETLLADLDPLGVEHLVVELSTTGGE